MSIRPSAVKNLDTCQTGRIQSLKPTNRLTVSEAVQVLDSGLRVVLFDPAADPKPEQPLSLAPSSVFP